MASDRVSDRAGERGVIVSSLEGILSDHLGGFPKGFPPALELGKRYRLDFEDCCVSGVIVGEFRGWRLVPDRSGAPPNYPVRVLFGESEIDAAWAVKADALDEGG